MTKRASLNRSHMHFHLLSTELLLLPSFCSHM